MLVYIYVPKCLTTCLSIVKHCKWNRVRKDNSFKNKLVAGIERT